MLRRASFVHRRLQHSGRPGLVSPARLDALPAAVRRLATKAAYGGEMSDKNQRTAMYMASVALATLGMAYASVPLYKVFCQATGFGGETKIASAEKARKMVPVADARPITVTFNADTSDTMPWKFRPLQRSVKVIPGETSLAFYRAVNPTDHAVTGVSTYNVVPMKAGVYFNKIQCFCFDEQRLRPGEEVDMPLFFFIDPEFAEDPQMEGVDNICLSYTFFKTHHQE